MRSVEIKGLPATALVTADSLGDWLGVGFAQVGGSVENLCKSILVISMHAIYIGLLCQLVRGDMK